MSQEFLSAKRLTALNGNERFSARRTANQVGQYPRRIFKTTMEIQPIFSEINGESFLILKNLFINSGVAYQRFNRCLTPLLYKFAKGSCL